MKKEEKREFVWKSLRVSFWVMVGSYLIGIIFSLLATYGVLVVGLGLSWILMLLSLLQIVSMIFTFIVAIMHLKKYKKKAFAVVAVVISSMLILFSLIGLIVFMNSLSGVVA